MTTSIGRHKPIKIPHNGFRWRIAVMMGVLLLGAACGHSPEEESQVTPLGNRMCEGPLTADAGRWAVVIGVSDHKHDTRSDPQRGMMDLRFAHHDAEALARFLISPAGGAFPRDHVLVLTDARATSGEVRKAMNDFLTRSLENDLVIIFFSGHVVAAPLDPEDFYLACHDTEPGKYAETAISIQEFAKFLKGVIPSRHVFVFLDGFRSPAAGRTGVASLAGELNEVLENVADSREGVTLVTASSEEEFSQEAGDLGGGHGVFSYHLLQGLGGPADQNRNGCITVAEALAYLSEHVKSQTGNTQNPWVSADVDADIVLGFVDSRASISAGYGAPGQTDHPDPQSLPSGSTGDMDFSHDSQTLLNLSRARMAKDDTEMALVLAEAVIRRRDGATPDALVLKIAILLQQGDLAGAETTEDFLVVPYAGHPAASEGAKLILNHYLQEISGASPEDAIQRMKTYLKRHPNGLLEKEAQQKLKSLQSPMSPQSRERFQKNLLLVKDLIDHGLFDLARDELDVADRMAHEALDQQERQMAFERIGALRTELDRAASTPKGEGDYQKLVDRTRSQTKGDAAGGLDRNGEDHSGTELDKGDGANSRLRNQMTSEKGEGLQARKEADTASLRQTEFQRHLTLAAQYFEKGDFKNAYETIERATKIATKDELAQIEALARRSNSPPKLQIIMDRETIEWEKPVRFRFQSVDTEGDPLEVKKWDFGDGNTSRDVAPEHTYGRWSGQDKERSYTVTLTVSDPFNEATVTKTLVVKRQEQIQIVTANGVSFRMVRIRKGGFTMGSPQNENGSDTDETQHTVHLKASYWLSETEVTQELWKAVMGNNPSGLPQCGRDCPVEKVSWDDCQEFLRRLNGMIPGGRFRLPTEAEWEYACRAGTQTAFSNGNIKETGCEHDPSLDTAGWYCGNANHATHPVGRKAPNPWGLYDMHGNVHEWCQDWHGEYPPSTAVDPKGPPSGSYRILRGGSWDSEARYCRSANRRGAGPDARHNDLGLRLARDVVTP